MRYGVYCVYDMKRDRFVNEVQCASDDVAMREFESWYRTMVRPSRWETRKLGRYFLVKIAYADSRSRNGPEEKLPKPVVLMLDDDVRMSWSWFWMADPPANEAEDAELLADFERMDAVDAARLARRGNQAA